jgi:hypothetical protein
VFCEWQIHDEAGCRVDEESCVYRFHEQFILSNRIHKDLAYIVVYVPPWRAHSSLLSLLGCLVARRSV